MRCCSWPRGEGGHVCGLAGLDKAAMLSWATPTHSPIRWIRTASRLAPATFGPSSGITNYSGVTRTQRHGRWFQRQEQGSPCVALCPLPPPNFLSSAKRPPAAPQPFCGLNPDVAKQAPLRLIHSSLPPPCMGPASHNRIPRAALVAAAVARLGAGPLQEKVSGWQQGD